MSCPAVCAEEPIGDRIVNARANIDTSDDPARRILIAN